MNQVCHGLRCDSRITERKPTDYPVKKPRTARSHPLLGRLIAVRDRLGGLHSAKIFSAFVDFAESGITTIGLLGTAFTMEQEFYKARVAAHGLTVIVPDVVQRAVIHRVIAGARS